MDQSAMKYDNIKEKVTGHATVHLCTVSESNLQLSKRWNRNHSAPKRYVLCFLSMSDLILRPSNKNRILNYSRLDT